MPSNVKVCINGFVLSTMLFDCTNNVGDQEGFLYGIVNKNERKEINDQSMNTTREDIMISICSSVPCGSFLSFYNNVGEIKTEDLLYNIGDSVENIVGWYRFRRYSAMHPAAREQATHRNLESLFRSEEFQEKIKYKIDTDHFVFGLLSSSNLPNFATHSYDYGFFCEKDDGTFKDLPLNILNLGDTRNSYRCSSMALPFMDSSSFNSVLSSSWNFSPFYESENQIHQFHQKLRMKLECLQEELAASDAVNASLEDDIRRLSNELQSLLATQEHLAGTGATTGLQFADKNDRENDREAAEIKEALEASAREAAERIEPEAIEVSGDVTEIIESELVVTSEVRIAAESKLDIEAGEGTSRMRLESPEREIDSQDSAEEAEFDSMDDDSDDSISSEGGESPIGSRLKRAPTESLCDDRATKRVCPDKYFEFGEYIDDKSVTSTVEETSIRQEESASSSSQLLAVDPNSGEMSSAQNEGGNLKSQVTSGEVEETTVPSPASNVEVLSGAGLQNFGTAMIEHLSSAAATRELEYAEGTVKQKDRDKAKIIAATVETSSRKTQEKIEKEVIEVSGDITEVTESELVVASERATLVIMKGEMGAAEVSTEGAEHQIDKTNVDLTDEGSIAVGVKEATLKRAPALDDERSTKRACPEKLENIISSSEELAEVKDSPVQLIEDSSATGITTEVLFKEETSQCESHPELENIFEKHSSRVNPPFIIYAAKEPSESGVDELGLEPYDQKEQEVKDLPHGSYEKKE